MSEVRQKILIVDDLAMNREILCEMLKDEYDVLQAQNGQEALQIMEQFSHSLRLVLLDMVMPVMDGEAVLKTMRERMLLNQIPVICISADSSMDVVNRAFELGATDYFLRPFDTTVVKRRVKNTIALYDKTGGNLKDALELLSQYYYQILKVNLTADTYLVLHEREGINQAEAFRRPSFSESLEAFAWSGYVLEEDRKSYLEFVDLKQLRERFRSEEALHLQYRHNVNGEYRWVSLEMYRSSEYTDDNQIVVLYIRDVNDDYLKRLDVLMQRTSDTLGMVTLNISRNICIAVFSTEESILQLVDSTRIETHLASVCAHALDQDERLKVMETFSQTNLLRHFFAGDNIVSGWLTVVDPKTQDYYRLGLTVEMVSNYMTGDVEGILRYSNNTAVYMAERMTKLLYQHSFDQVFVIACNRRKLHIENPGDLNGGQFKRQNLNYDLFISELARSRVASMDREAFLKGVQLEEIVRQLEEKPRYTISVHMLNENGRRRLKNFSFVYLDPKRQIVLGAMEDVTDLAEQDGLTGGYNRQGFIRRASELLGREKDPEQYSLLYFNVVDFKAINTLFGQKTGDQILKNIYRNLGASALKPELMARVESDHFACLLRRENLDFSELEQLCKQQFLERRVTISAFLQCGVLLTVHPGDSVDELIAMAEVAVKYIRDEYTSPYFIYNDSMRTEFVNKAQLEQDFEQALLRREFEVYYQPIVDTATGKIASAEALVRWNHPERGLLGPGLFVPPLEDKGRVSQLDHYVAAQIAQFLCDRMEDGKPCVPISLNLSWIDFYDDKFIQWIMATLDYCRDHGIKTRIEITETSYMAISQEKKQVANEMRERGAELLMDDFGSGYASFGVLQNYCFDILKLDISLIRQITTNEKTRCILRSLIQMAHELNMRLVAEGVESEEQLAFLRECGCDYIQGFYYYKPMPEDEFRALID